MSKDTKELAYAITLDTSELEDKSKRAADLFRGIGDSADDGGNRIASSIGKMGAAFLSFSAATSFVKQIVKTRSEIESLEVSFQTLTGSMETGTALLNEIKEFAVSTPMMLGDLAKGAQTLLGFNIEAEKVMPILKQIGDISMGDAQKFNSLTLAFSQMSSTGKLMGQDLLQMINAGFNPLTEIAAKTGKTVGELKEEMAAGKITVEMVADAFASATSEGGKFYQMLEKQSQTLGGAISNLQGAVEDALNELGEKTQGVVLSAVNLATDLVKNYETIGKVLGQLIILYGSYKVALATTIAIEKAKKAIRFAQEYVTMSRALGVATANQIAFNTAAMANPYVWIAVAVAGIAGLVGSIALWKSGTDDTVESIGALEQAMIDERNEVNKLSQQLTSANKTEEERQEIIKKLQKLSPELVKGLDDEADAIQTVTERLEEYNRQASIRAALAKKQDTVNDKTSATGTAQASVEGAKLELQQALDTLMDEFDNLEIKKAGGIFGMAKVTDEERAEIRSSVEAVMEDTKLTVEQQAAQIKNILNATHAETVMNTAGQWQTRVVQDVKTSGDALEAFVAVFNDAADAQRNYASAVDAQVAAEQSLADATKAADVALKENQPQTEDVKKVNNYSDAVKKLTTEITDLEKKLKEYRSGKGDLGTFNSVEEAIKDAEGKLDESKKSYKDLTGQEYGKQSTEVKQREKAKEELKKALSDGELKASEAEISAMKEGLTRKLAQIELDRLKTEAAIDKEIADLEKKAKEAGETVDDSTYALFSQRKTYNNQVASNARAEAERQNTEEIAQMYRDLGDVFASEEQRKLSAISTTYEKMREELKQSLEGGSITAGQYQELLDQTTEAEKQEIDDFWSESYSNYVQRQQKLKDDWSKILQSVPAEYAAEANRQFQQALDKLNSEEFQRSGEYQKFFTANLTMAKDEVEAIAQRVKSNLNAQLRAGTITAEDFLNTWEKIEQQVRDVESATGDLMNYMNGGLDGLISNRQNLGRQMQSSGTIDYQKAAEEYEKALAEGNVEAENTALANMQSAEAMQSAGASMSAAAGQAASTVAIIDTIIHGINNLVNGIADTVDLIADMADAYGADTSVDSKWGKTQQFFSTFAEASQHATDGWDSLKNGDLGGVIKGVVGSWTSWFTSYAKYNDAKIDEKIKEDAEAVEDLQDAYDELGDSISKAFGSNAVNLIEQQNANLEQQNELIRQQIEAEESKKNSDSDAVEDYNKQIEENNKLIRENKEAAIDAIFGEDVQSAISNYVDAVTSAWAEGNSAAKGSKETIKEMMKSMVTESIKAYVEASGKMQKIREAMQLAMADGIITEEERQRLEQMGDELADEIEKKYGWSDKMYQEDEERTGKTGSGIAASQESVDTLDARTTTIQGHTFSLVQGQQELISTSSKILDKLYDIEENTGSSAGHLDKMREDISKMKGTVDDISRMGVKIRN
jgi:tape measure domain-containing protein